MRNARRWTGSSRGIGWQAEAGFRLGWRFGMEAGWRDRWVGWFAGWISRANQNAVIFLLMRTIVNSDYWWVNQ